MLSLCSPNHACQIRSHLPYHTQNRPFAAPSNTDCEGESSSIISMTCRMSPSLTKDTGLVACSLTLKNLTNSLSLSFLSLLWRNGRLACDNVFRSPNKRILLSSSRQHLITYMTMQDHKGITKHLLLILSHRCCKDNCRTRAQPNSLSLRISLNIDTSLHQSSPNFRMSPST